MKAVIYQKYNHPGPETGEKFLLCVLTEKDIATNVQKKKKPSKKPSFSNNLSLWQIDYCSRFSFLLCNRVLQPSSLPGDLAVPPTRAGRGDIPTRSLTQVPSWNFLCPVKQGQIGEPYLTRGFKCACMVWLGLLGFILHCEKCMPHAAIAPSASPLEQDTWSGLEP